MLESESDMLDIATLNSELLEYDLENVEHYTALACRSFVTPTTEDFTSVQNRLLKMSLSATSLGQDNLPQPDGVQDIPLSFLARSLSNSMLVDDFKDSYLLALAAMHAAMAGTFPTAKVFAETRLKSEDLLNEEYSSGVEKWLITLLSRVSLRTKLETVPEPFVKYYKLLRKGLKLGNRDYFESAEKEFSEAVATHFQEFTDSDQYLLLLWTYVHSRIAEFAAAPHLRNSCLPENYVDALIKKTPLLFPSQLTALKNNSVLSSESNLLVLLPTSTGKSLIGEMALVASLCDDRPIGIYLAPYRALSHQVFEKMKLRLSECGISCEQRRGGYLSDLTDVEVRKTIIVATPEAFDTLIRQRPLLLDKISCCVFDELHLIEQSGRGVCYEGLAARLMAAKSRVVALSPVVKASKELKNWLNVGDIEIVQSRWHPAGRRVAIVEPSGNTFYFTPSERLSADASREPAWTGNIKIPSPIQNYPQHYSGYQPLRDSIIRNAASVAFDQYSRFKEQVLVVARSKSQARDIASAVSTLFAPLDESNLLIDFANEIEENFPYLKTLHRCLLHGVCYHNSALPNSVKEQLEKKIDRGYFKVVVSTTTLAEGVDLPFRVVVLAEWQQSGMHGVAPMSSLLFRNIAGRCGRAGRYSEGDTILIDHPGKSFEDLSSSKRINEFLSRYVFAGPTDLKPSAEAIDTSHAKQKNMEITASIESQLFAFIAANPLIDDQLSLFTENLFSSNFSHANQFVESTCLDVVNKLLIDPNYKILTRNSPLKLTELGKTALITGLSPRSSLQLIKAITSYTWIPESRSGRIVRQRHLISWNSLAIYFSQLIRDDKCELPEMKSGGFARIGTKYFPVKWNQFDSLLLGWISGLPFEELAYLTIMSAPDRNYYEKWLHQIHDDLTSQMEGRIEEVVTFFNGYISNQWSWVLRGAYEISKTIKPELAEDLNVLAIRIEFGVEHPFAGNLIKLGCNVDRAKIDFMVGNAKSATKNKDLCVGSLLRYLQNHTDSIVNVAVGTFQRTIITQLDIENLQQFLEKQRDTP